MICRANNAILFREYIFSGGNMHTDKKSTGSGNSVATTSNAVHLGGILVTNNGNGTIRTLNDSTIIILRGYAVTSCIGCSFNNGDSPCAETGNCTLCSRNNALGMAGSVVSKYRDKSCCHFGGTNAISIGCALLSDRSGVKLNANGCTNRPLFISGSRCRLTSTTNACAGN